jgi:hypothetical protein
MESSGAYQKVRMCIANGGQVNTNKGKEKERKHNV